MITSFSNSVSKRRNTFMDFWQETVEVNVSAIYAQLENEYEV
jgi:hypothetical protein